MASVHLPLLTIGIPKYNGELAIRQTLDSVVNQMHAGQHDIEVFVSDNGSTDQTANIIADYQARWPDLIRHSRNERNLGFDGNVDGNGDALLNIALASGTLYQSMKKVGYDAKRIQKHLDRDRRYVFDAIPRAKYWGIKHKKALISKLISVHNGPGLWLRWIPLILLPDTVYAPLYKFRAWATSRLKPLEHKLKARLKSR